MGNKYIRRWLVSRTPILTASSMTYLDKDVHGVKELRRPLASIAGPYSHSSQSTAFTGRDFLQDRISILVEQTAVQCGGYRRGHSARPRAQMPSDNI